MNAVLELQLLLPSRGLLPEQLLREDPRVVNMEEHLSDALSAAAAAAAAW